MAVLLIAGTTVAAIAFMAIFFVAISKEARRMKIFEVMKVDTESMVAAADSNLSFEKLGHFEAHTTGTILPMTEKNNRVRESEDARHRKPA